MESRCFGNFGVDCVDTASSAAQLSLLLRHGPAQQQKHRSCPHLHAAGWGDNELHLWSSRAAGLRVQVL
eukprot:5290103-Prymnesium_polylepis.1